MPNRSEIIFILSNNALTLRATINHASSPRLILLCSRPDLRTRSVCVPLAFGGALPPDHASSEEEASTGPVSDGHWSGLHADTSCSLQPSYSAARRPPHPSSLYLLYPTHLFRCETNDRRDEVASFPNQEENGQNWFCYMYYGSRALYGAVLYCTSTLSLAAAAQGN